MPNRLNPPRNLPRRPGRMATMRALLIPLVVVLAGCSGPPKSPEEKRCIEECFITWDCSDPKSSADLQVCLMGLKNCQEGC